MNKPYTSQTPEYRKKRYDRLFKSTTSKRNKNKRCACGNPVPANYRYGRCNECLAKLSAGNLADAYSVGGH